MEDTTRKPSKQRYKVHNKQGFTTPIVLLLIKFIFPITPLLKKNRVIKLVGQKKWIKKIHQYMEHMWLRTRTEGPCVF